MNGSNEDDEGKKLRWHEYEHINKRDRKKSEISRQIHSIINCLIMWKIAKIQYVVFCFLSPSFSSSNCQRPWLSYAQSFFLHLVNLREDELKDVLVNHRCRCSPLEEKLTYYQMNTRYHYEYCFEKEREESERARAHERERKNTIILN